MKAVEERQLLDLIPAMGPETSVVAFYRRYNGVRLFLEPTSRVALIELFSVAKIRKRLIGFRKALLQSYLMAHDDELSEVPSQDRLLSDTAIPIGVIGDGADSLALATSGPARGHVFQVRHDEVADESYTEFEAFIRWLSADPDANVLPAFGSSIRLFEETTPIQWVPLRYFAEEDDAIAALQSGGESTGNT